MPTSPKATAAIPGAFLELRIKKQDLRLINKGNQNL
jgi:hypothetical protein